MPGGDRRTGRRRRPSGCCAATRRSRSRQPGPVRRWRGRGRGRTDRPPRAGRAASQQELAARMGIAPSLVVSLADHLEGLGAVQRVRDPQDRRRQVLTLTEEGRRLLDRCESAARALDEEFGSGLTADQRRALDEALQVLANRVGLP
ncbi:MarR family winged helix-turn-helix transcriptional regulator [Streptantibioticus ferralitis]|uniref:MarR family transcriptional regulator n=1 Tax=Streptantibioticus ferralitis TaxID=236510 RepID=A0ABT5Z5A7_9ACTN|nr:MarR family transcriptional regulator [Streptantibioticus ferralitis]MDF2259011.1 MarR family transcriptional regulator [Streptantibioticus ferralitis]